MPELSRALAAQVGSANIKVVVDRKTSFRVNSSPEGITFGNPKIPKLVEAPASFEIGETIGNNAITPEPSNTGKVFRLILILLILFGLTYVFLHYR